MATVGLYGSTASSTVASPSGSESVGLYGNNTVFGGSYFEWFIFQVSDTQPSTPTGGSWDFTTNTGTPPTGWLASPPVNPTNTVWVSIGLVNSKSTVAITWSVPGKFSFSSGLPILSGTATPLPGDGQTDQLYIQTSTTPETIWFKQAGTWTRLTGSTLYADLTSNQTLAGIKTFSSPIAGSVTGTSANVTGIVSITNGGTGTTSANSAFNALAPSQTGNSGKFLTTDGSNTSWSTNPLGTVTSVAVSGGTTGLTTSGGPITTSGTITLAGTLAVANGGTGVTTSTGTGSVVLNTGASLGSATVSDYETFTSVAAPTYTEGRLWYDSTQKALTYNSDISGNSLHVGQETQLKVRNGTGSTIAKGAPVYITSTATGVSFPNIALAKADTLTTGNCIGLTNEAIASGADGYVVINGILNGVNTGTFTVGDVLYVSPYSAGQLMNTFPPTGYPVKIGVVSFVNSSTGSIYINQSNAFVQASSVIGTLAIANGGTGATTATAAFNALAPTQTGNSGKYLTTDGTNTSWATNPLGTVTSVGGTGTVNGLTLTGTVTTSGNLTLGGTLDLSSPPAIGATAANTGAFTTLSASSTVTLSGGTANGVGYLNGSKVLTTGTALTFDGTNLGVGAAATAIAGTVLQITGTTYAFNVVSDSTGTVKGQLYADHANDLVGIGSRTNHPVIFQLNNTEQMRLTSTGLGIGTSSPAKKLDVNGDALIYGLTVGRGAGAVSTNTAVGASALAAASTTGGSNIAVGYQSLGYNSAGVTGAENVGIGYQSLGALTSGYNNIAVADYALRYTTTGSNNVAVGLQALQSNTTASNNTAVGYQAGYSNTTGTAIVAVGQGALYNNTASNNTALGKSSLNGNTTGTENSAGGKDSLGSNTTGSYNTAFGSNALVNNTTASANTAVGYQAGYSNTTATATTAIGYKAAYSNTTTNGVTAVGYQAAQTLSNGNTNNYGEVYIGDSAGLNATTATDIVSVGSNSLRANSTGAKNVAVGAAALLSNTTASNNTAVGYQAGYSNTTGGVTAFGYQAGYTNTTGAGMVAFGAQAGYTYNSGAGYGAVFVGNNAGKNTTANDNVFVGTNSGQTNSTGAYNTVVGTAALFSNTTASYNTAVGYQAGYGITTGQYNTVFGPSGSALGLTTGSYNLYSGVAARASSSSVSYEMVITSDSSATVGKGSSTGFMNPGSGGMYQYNNSTLWSITSDQRIKKNIVNNDTGLSVINQIQVRNFEYRLPEEITDLPQEQAVAKQGVQLGVIAQELQQILPECVKTESTGVMTVDADNLTWYLVNAVKELSAQVAQLQSQLKG